MESNKKIILVCKSGGVYQPKHANWLARQLNTSIYILTDFPSNEFVGLNVISLKFKWCGWWSKMEIFRPDILPNETFLYLDLDTVVKEIDNDWFASEYIRAPKGFRISDKMQSGVMILPYKERLTIWEEWIKSPDIHIKENRGDQDFLSKTIKYIDFFKNADISSYKFTPKKTAGAKIVCFHGNPKPWEVAESWVNKLNEQPFDSNKTCILVGNGPSILSQTNGKKIDSFDEVIRINEYKTHSYEIYTGSKTTFWATFGKGRLPGDRNKFPEKIIMVHEHSVAAYTPKEMWRIPMSYYNNIREELQMKTQRCSDDIKKIIPSTGYLVARWLISQNIHPTLTGFDFFSKKNLHQHHYWHNHPSLQPPEHDGDLECIILQKFVNQQKLSFL